MVELINEGVLNGIEDHHGEEEEVKDVPDQDLALQISGRSLPR